MFPEYDFIEIINFSSNGVSFRTRKDDVNLTKLAKVFNGGGHPKAAGCPIPNELKYNFIDELLDVSRK